MRKVSGGELERSLRGGFGGGRKFELKALSFEWASDAEANSAGEEAAQVNECEEASGRAAIDFEQARDDTEDWGEVSELSGPAESSQSIGWKGLFGGDDEGFTEKTTATVCDVIGEERLAELIEVGKARWSGVGIEDEWE